MKHLRIALLPLLISACTAQTVEPKPKKQPEKVVEIPQPSKVELYYAEHVQDSIPSTAIGTINNGKLKNGTLLPFSGKNYTYFDTTSYLSGRGFMHSKVAKTLIDSYDQLDSLRPGRHFYLMECANQHGGKIFPHRTHQNGLSADLMVPLIKDQTPYYELDKTGTHHYLLEFDNDGKWDEDPSVSIDFELIALHLLELQKAAKLNGLSIEKVILKTELRDELYSGEYGKKLQQSGIYITRNLTPLINGLHDDHYHVDFRELDR